MTQIHLVSIFLINFLPFHKGGQSVTNRCLKRKEKNLLIVGFKPMTSRFSVWCPRPLGYTGSPYCLIFCFKSVTYSNFCWFVSFYSLYIFCLCTCAPFVCQYVCLFLFLFCSYSCQSEFPLSISWHQPKEHVIFFFIFV